MNSAGYIYACMCVYVYMYVCNKIMVLSWIFLIISDVDF